MAGADWLLEKVVEKAKPAKVPHPTRDDVAIAEKFLSEPEAVRRLTFGIAKVAESVRMLQEGGLTEEALCLLIQHSIGYVGKNMVATSTISKVLVAAANLDRRFLEPEAEEKRAVRR